MPTLALVDGHSLAYRAFYALPPDLATSSGLVTNAAFGFTSMLIKLLGEHRPDGMAVAWDVGRSTFRTERYADYKAQRASTPDLFRSQLPLIREVLEAMGILQMERPGFEADDVIATIVKMVTDLGWQVLVVTGDRDSFQLVSPTVRVIYTRRGISDTVMVDPEWVEGKYGVRPGQYLDYAALRGDTSDNLPGVPGVGEKTAARLLSEFDDLEGVLSHVETFPPRLRSNLTAHREQVLLNRELMALVDDLDLEVDEDRLRRRDLDWPSVQAVFDRLEFATLWTRLTDQEGGTSPVAETAVEVEVRVVQSATEAATLAGAAGLAVEPVHESGELIGLMVVPLLGEAAPGGSEPMAGTAYYVPASLLDDLAPALADPGVPHSAYKSKKLAQKLHRTGYELDGLEFDPELAGYIIGPAGRSEKLEDLASRFLAADLTATESGAADDGQATFDFGGGPDLEAAGARAMAVRDLQAVMEAELADRDQLTLLREMELPLVRVLARMEQHGIAVDSSYLEQMGAGLGAELAGLETEIHEQAGRKFNIKSSQQFGKVLFGDLGLRVVKKTSRGTPSTDASVLEKLKEAHPIVGLVLRYREVEKLRSTYVKGYLPLIGPDQRIHARFNQTGASTGRLSSDRPNLQNIPVRSELGRTIRRAFVAAEGFRFVVADYSQIELRILAHLSEDPGLLDAFLAGEDIHTATAARVFGLTAATVTADTRRRAKAINFGLLYGMEAYGLADRLKIGRAEAQEHMDTYFRQFPDVRHYLREVVREARKVGYTTTLFGRRRYLPELLSGNWRTRQMGERMALNAPVQGSAADVIKIAMIELDRHLAPDQARMLLQIHDELVFEVREDAVEPTVRLVREMMEGVVELAVPLTVDVGIGPDLASVKE
ncbi:MAG: DNA polymerase I [bacterium]|nr:DNA polymerase I [bacterium]MDE0353039.1 DNA polymerase I [bacterium]